MPIIALSLGASVAALAVCVEQGAVGLFHTDLLSQELARQAARRLNGNGGSSPGGYDEPRGPGQLPAPYDALVHLTPSERRVLFHMMEGDRPLRSPPLSWSPSLPCAHTSDRSCAS